MKSPTSQRLLSNRARARREIGKNVALVASALSSKLTDEQIKRLSKQKAVKAALLAVANGTYPVIDYGQGESYDYKIKMIENLADLPLASDLEITLEVDDEGRGAYRLAVLAIRKKDAGSDFQNIRLPDFLYELEDRKDIFVSMHSMQNGELSGQESAVCRYISEHGSILFLLKGQDVVLRLICGSYSSEAVLSGNNIEAITVSKAS